MTHCFAVCAYKDSPYLRECMESLRLQEHPSPLLLCTATPFPLSGKYGQGIRRYLLRESPCPWNRFRLELRHGASQGRRL